MAGVSVRAATAEMERAFSHLRPGFRFHPTDQELVSFYLRHKVLGHGGYFIPEVDLYKLEPHQLPGKSFSPSSNAPGAKVEWYFFALRGRKYPTGFRMVRATLKGFWKSTGKDRPVMQNDIVIGMKKTLMFHIRRTPSATRTGWVMHEYRLHGHHIQDTYALCRVFNKNMASPSPNASSDVDTDDDLMQFVPGVIDIGNDPMEYVCGDADSGQDSKHSVLGGVEADRAMMEYRTCSTSSNMLGGVASVQDLMQSMLDGIGTDKDPIQVQAESDGTNMENDFMQSVLGGVGADMDPIHVVSKSDAANANKDLMQFAFGGMGIYQNPIQIESEDDGVDTDEGEKQFLTDGDDTGNVEMQILSDAANKDQEAMQHVTGGTIMDEDNSENSWYTKYLVEEDNSWTPSQFDDILYTSDDMGMIP